jgi:hypothetical protein
MKVPGGNAASLVASMKPYCPDVNEAALWSTEWRRWTTRIFEDLNELFSLAG